MKLQSKLTEWLESGIITVEIKDAIARHEGTQGSSSYALYSIITLAILAIAVGVISLFAANWSLMPPMAKIGSNSLLHLITVSLLIIYRKSFFAKEALLVLEFALIMTTILLVGYLYSLNIASVYEVTLWILIGGPLLLLSRSYFNYYVLVGTVAAAHALYVHKFYTTASSWTQVLLTTPPIILFLVSEQKWIKEQLRDALKYFSYLYGIIFFIIIATLNWYFESSDPLIGWLGAGSALLAFLPQFIHFIKRKQWLHLLLFLTALAYYFAPLSFIHGNLKNYAGAVFIATALASSYLFNRVGNRLLFDIAIFLAGVRIFSLYFEFFGHKVQAGIILLLSGFFILLIIWARKMSSKLFPRR